MMPVKKTIYMKLNTLYARHVKIHFCNHKCGSINYYWKWKFCIDEKRGNSIILASDSLWAGFKALADWIYILSLLNVMKVCTIILIKYFIFINFGKNSCKNEFYFPFFLLIKGIYKQKFRVHFQWMAHKNVLKSSSKFKI